MARKKAVKTPKTNSKRKVIIEDDHNLPRKSLFRIEEVANYFDVAQSTIYLWKDHDILDHERIGGIIRIPRESILRCRARFSIIT